MSLSNRLKKNSFQIEPMNMIQEIKGFRHYLEGLSIQDSTLNTYSNLVFRIDRELRTPISSEAVSSEDDVKRIAESLIGNEFPKEYRKDLRCIIRYYLKYTHPELFKPKELREKTFSDISLQLEQNGDFNGSQKVLRAIALRRGQREFRRRLMLAYGSSCCITSTSVTDILEAAHIEPYAIGGKTVTQNGLLLRADIHTLFDLKLISINPENHTVFCSKELLKSKDYQSLHGKKMILPKKKDDHPSPDLLQKHYLQAKSP
ncbi:MAG TPA: HNH endonuclease signature motif containing protein [Verrucomicrobiae bacterium]